MSKESGKPEIEMTTLTIPSQEMANILLLAAIGMFKAWYAHSPRHQQLAEEMILTAGFSQRVAPKEREAVERTLERIRDEMSGFLKRDTERKLEKLRRPL